MSFGDYATADLAVVTDPYATLPVTAHAWAVETQRGRPGREFWMMVLIAGQTSTYRTEKEARRKASYLGWFYRRSYATPPPVRIVKLTMTRELVS